MAIRFTCWRQQIPTLKFGGGEESEAKTQIFPESGIQFFFSSNFFPTSLSGHLRCQCNCKQWTTTMYPTLSPVHTKKVFLPSFNLPCCFFPSAWLTRDKFNFLYMETCWKAGAISANIWQNLIFKFGVCVALFPLVPPCQEVFILWYWYHLFCHMWRKRICLVKPASSLRAG